MTIILGGKIGDVIYELAAVRQISDGGQVEVALVQDDAFSLTADELDLVIPFLSGLPYISVARRRQGGDAGLDIFGEWFFDYSHERNVLVDLFNALGLDVSRAKEAWLPVETGSNGLTFINRTGRYSNDKVNWPALLAEFPMAHFLGIEEELVAFRALVGQDVPYVETPTFVDYVTQIAGCDRLLGSQSAGLALAHGMGKPVIVETSIEHPNCIFLRENARYEGVDDAFAKLHGL